MKSQWTDCDVGKEKELPVSAVRRMPIKQRELKVELDVPFCR